MRFVGSFSGLPRVGQESMLPTLANKPLYKEFCVIMGAIKRCWAYGGHHNTVLIPSYPDMSASIFLITQFSNVMTRILRIFAH